MASDSISEHLFFKIFLGGHAPRPPSISMLRMLIVHNGAYFLMPLGFASRKIIRRPPVIQYISFGPPLTKILKETLVVHQAVAIMCCTQQVIQGENFRDRLKIRKNRESFPTQKFCRIWYIPYVC